MREQLFEQFLKKTSFALSEGSIYERLRQHPAIEFDPYLAHVALIYNAGSALILEQVHREYLDVGQQHNLAMFALTDTWRGNQERIGQSVGSAAGACALPPLRCGELQPSGGFLSRRMY